MFSIFQSKVTQKVTFAEQAIEFPEVSGID